MRGTLLLGLVEDKRLALQRGGDRADELGERRIAAAQCRECRKGGMVAPSRDVPLDGRRALRRRANRGSDEAIAAPRYRLDVARLFRVVVERRPHFADGRLEHRVGDEPMAPDERRATRSSSPGCRGCAPVRKARRRASARALRVPRRTSAVPRPHRARNGRSAAARPDGSGFMRGLLPLAPSGWKKGPRHARDPLREEEGEGGKSRDRRGEAVRVMPQRLGACRSARHCDEVHRRLRSGIRRLSRRDHRLRLWYSAPRCDFASASLTHSRSSSGANGLMR